MLLVRMLKTNKMVWVGVPTLLALALGCSAQKPDLNVDVPSVTAAAVADDELSYRNEPLLDPSNTPTPSFAAPDPGEAKLLARSFENSPPMIPHNTDDLLPILLQDNQCLDCHLPENAADADATPVPASHQFDIRAGQQLSGLSMANFDCTLCHATQAEVAPLIDNTFKPYFRTKDGASQSNLLEILNDGIE